MQTGGLDSILALPMPMLVGLGALVLVQLTLAVIALLDLYRRPVEQVATGKKWIWVVIILFVNTIGSIIYLVIGRKPAAAAEVRPTAPAATRTADAADLLYGKDTDPR
jgi:hypothetical protein